MICNICGAPEVVGCQHTNEGDNMLNGRMQAWEGRKAKLRDAYGDNDPYLYSYAPGDTKGTRHVFQDRTCFGYTEAIEYADELLDALDEAGA